MDEQQQKLQAALIECGSIMMRTSFYRSGDKLIPGDEVGCLLQPVQNEALGGLGLPAVLYGVLLAPQRMEDCVIVPTTKGMRHVGELAIMLYDSKKNLGATHKQAFDLTELELTVPAIDTGSGRVWSTELLSPIMLKVDLLGRINDCEKALAAAGFITSWPQTTAAEYKEFLRDMRAKQDQGAGSTECGPGCDSCGGCGDDSDDED